MSRDNTSKGFGIGMVLFIIFLILKLTETGVVAKWSWWAVTCPLWFPIAFSILLLLIASFDLRDKD
jgi:hypothetical protein